MYGIGEGGYNVKKWERRGKGEKEMGNKGELGEREMEWGEMEGKGEGNGGER